MTNRTQAAPHRFPDFLLIGAQKCGTTSLFFDLAQGGGVFWPSEKEPGHLADDAVLTASGGAAYGELFRRARRDQICGEASTAYSKLPDIPGVPERARRVCGGDLKILYLVREPVARVISHHYHELGFGTMGADIDRAVREEPSLLDNTRYAMQVRPWIERFGREQVRIVRFESYIADRVGTVAEVLHFLGARGDGSRIRAEKIHNRSDGKPAPRGAIWRMSRGPAYRNWVRPLLPRAVRSRLMGLLLPQAPPRPEPPSPATVDLILDTLADDVAELQELAGAAAPLWDLEAVRRRHCHLSSAGEDTRAAAGAAGSN